MPYLNFPHSIYLFVFVKMNSSVYPHIFRLTKQFTCLHKRLAEFKSRAQHVGELVVTVYYKLIKLDKLRIELFNYQFQTRNYKVKEIIS